MTQRTMVAAGDDVICVDNLYTGRKANCANRISPWRAGYWIGGRQSWVDGVPRTTDYFRGLLAGAR